MVKKTQKIDPNDVIILAGDFNADGSSDNIKSKSYRDQLKHLPKANELMDELDKEYETMIKVLTNNFEDHIVDCAREAYHGESPITYADRIVDENGNELPAETTLTNSDDYLTCQSLDYIFYLKRKH